MSVFKYRFFFYTEIVMCVFLCVCMYQCVFQFVCMNVSELYCLCIVLYLCLFACLLVCWRLYSRVRRRILNERDFEVTNNQTDENPSPHITNSKSNLNIASGQNPTTVPIVPGGTSSSSTMGRLSGRAPFKYVMVNKLLLHLQALLCFYQLLCPISSFRAWF